MNLDEKKELTFLEKASIVVKVIVLVIYMDKCPSLKDIFFFVAVFQILRQHFSPFETYCYLITITII